LAGCGLKLGYQHGGLPLGLLAGLPAVLQRGANAPQFGGLFGAQLGQRFNLDAGGCSRSIRRNWMTRSTVRWLHTLSLSARRPLKPR
jgi:hypothetical protein